MHPLTKRKSNAGVVKLVDTLDLGSSASRCEGSSPFARTKQKLNKVLITELSFFSLKTTPNTTPQLTTLFNLSAFSQIIKFLL